MVDAFAADTPLSPILVGVAGEYFVAAELSRLGLIASITLRNTKGVDVLVSDPDGARSVSIQVKTNHGSKKQWILNRKAEDYEGADLFYVFVALNGQEGRPAYHVVPSKQVAAQVKASHGEWLLSPNKKGERHNDNPIRNFLDIGNNYLDRWDLIMSVLRMPAAGQ